MVQKHNVTQGVPVWPPLVIKQGSPTPTRGLFSVHVGGPPNALPTGLVLDRDLGTISGTTNDPPGTVDTVIDYQNRRATSSLCLSLPERFLSVYAKTV